MLIFWISFLRSITPLDEIHAGSSQDDYREVDEGRQNKKIARSVTMINVQPVEWWNKSMTELNFML